MRKISITTIIALLMLSLLTSQGTAIAASTGNPYAAAQAGLSYQVLQPGTTGDLLLRSFKLLTCGTNKDKWLAAIYGEDRSIQFLETDAAVKCSNPGLGVKVATTTINGSKATIVAFCDPANAKQWKNCKTSDIHNYGGYAMWNTKATKLLHATSVEVLVSGLTYADLLKISRAMKPVIKP
ncbi:MAG: hypothetical protein WCJ16_06355 [Actinomycetes bacterium]|jgi:hypothetical protein